MKFAVGYQLPDEHSSIMDTILQYKEHIQEVFFPWLSMASGRGAMASCRGYVNWKAQEILEEELRALKKAGIKLDLLFNSNCYGKYAVSTYLSNNVCSIIEHINEAVGMVDIITTTSPAIAHIIKSEFPGIEVRASVNMRIGTVKGMQYVSHLFDSFYLQREYNRDFDKIREIKAWTDQNDKKLLLLGNSGCMNFCSGQTFHDNLVAHDAEIDEVEKIRGWNPHICWNYLKNKENWVSVLQNSWIRPEDLYQYEKYFKVVKLATRMHSRPGMVIQAYASRRHYGNLLDLCEPGYGPAFAPYIIDNSKFPEDWFERTTRCRKNCHQCSYCAEILKQVLINTEEF